MQLINTGFIINKFFVKAKVNVSHRDEVDDLIRKGRDIERIALARAVRLHLNHQVFVYNSKTAVFD